MEIFKKMKDITTVLAIITTLFFGIAKGNFWEIMCSFWISFSWFLERRIDDLIEQKYMLNELCFKLIRKYQKGEEEI